MKDKIVGRFEDVVVDVKGKGGVWKGQVYTTRKLFLWVNDLEIDPVISQAILNHSPDGFWIGYGGLGPAQTALAILYEVTRDHNLALRWHQEFKWEFIATLQADINFKINMDVTEWLKGKVQSESEQAVRS